MCAFISLALPAWGSRLRASLLEADEASEQERTVWQENDGVEERVLKTTEGQRGCPRRSRRY